MGDGDNRMTAAEEVLAWILIEKIGVPDDVGYSPQQAQDIIVSRLAGNVHSGGNLGRHALAGHGGKLSGPESGSLAPSV